ncbi:hypothetical protein CLIB1444_06S04060 [[Candida] jaroonii]|uniref:Uncharacterized protein n=1 Tax=[Candida] jaroonii TaxID=467808 RepID=A0ACA9YA02_9ASCO|nr:hypothetical protein CLIB1444_06S04060 [[Candida] jaroonii]
MKIFGGAIEIDLPTGVIDVSQFRQVPDNQEVFLIEKSTANEDQNIIIELLEQPEGEINEVLNTHLSDIFDDVKPFKYDSLKENSYMVEYENFLIGLIRFDKFETDILVSFNNSHDTQVFKSIVGSLKILDPSLFG